MEYNKFNEYTDIHISLFEREFTLNVYFISFYSNKFLFFSYFCSRIL